MKNFTNSKKSLFNELNKKIIELEQQLNDRNEFLDHAVHELRGAVHNIYFISDYLRGQWLDIIPSRQREHVNLVQELAEHLKILSEKLMDFFLISSETNTQNFDHVDLVELVNDSIKHCQIAFIQQYPNLQILFYADDVNKATIKGNSLRIRQVITNFVSQCNEIW